MMMIVMSDTRVEVMMSMVLIIFNTKVMLMMIPYQGDTSLGLNTVMWLVELSGLGRSGCDGWEQALWSLDPGTVIAIAITIVITITTTILREAFH